MFLPFIKELCNQMSLYCLVWQESITFFSTQTETELVPPALMLPAEPSCGEWLMFHFAHIDVFFLRMPLIIPLFIIYSIREKRYGKPLK